MKHTRKISVIGLGYVGLYVAVAFGKKHKVIGYDINEARIQSLKKGHDTNKELNDSEFKGCNIDFTTNIEDLKQADFHIVAVQTPIDKMKQPDFEVLKRISKTLGGILKQNDIIVYESTVYPGATEELCIPALEEGSNKKCGEDFFVGYSPERVNPGDKEHTFFNTVKIISAIDTKTLEIIKQVYGEVILAGVYPVSSIKVAEAVKIVENTQRDINISLVNEIALIMHNFGINATEVLAAAETKWNFIPFRPGIVGGHCIGPNSYFLTYKSEENGYYPDLIYAGRRINELMPKFIARETIKKLIRQNVKIKNSVIAVFGLTYKENCSDFRDSKMISLINELKKFEVNVLVTDPLADSVGVKKEYGIDLKNINELNHLDAIILAVSHQYYLNLDPEEYYKKLNSNKLIVDVKGVLDPTKFRSMGIELWQI